ncbi:MAG: acetyltransferase [Candidatus Acidiferrales bacterium]|jgi:predicted GNAT superfamily acetyltransferase
MNASAKHPAAVTGEIEVRHCESLAEYEECVKLELLTWGEHIAVPSAIFVVAHHTGGQILGAFDGIRMVGFTLALAGTRAGKPFLHSHMTAVLPEYQNRGVGRRLKLFQREDALKNGVPLVEWTFDPLELKNARFNLTRLGAIVRRYIPNFYGVTASPLHAGLPTDRLVAEWWLDSDRVRGILAGSPFASAGAVERISLHTHISHLKSKDPAAGARSQKQVRESFQRHFLAGYVATGVEARGETTDYILEPAGSIGGLRLPEYRPEEFED